MSVKDVLVSIGMIIVFGLLLLYWFLPTQSFESFSSNSTPKDANFTIGGSNAEGMQFYNNLRFPEKQISYKIVNCPLQKAQNMKDAFAMIENLTVLDFYPVSSDEEILVTCDSQTKFDGEFFVAGEGGPTNIIQAGDLNVIRSGGIQLLRDSNCERPNVAVHELLHALGFAHSTNPSNIMYPVSKCSQNIGSDIVQEINRLYALPGLPDLVFENASAFMHGRYLDINMTIRNDGLKDSESANVITYADNEKVDEISTDKLEVGSGRYISLKNILVLQSSVKEIRLSIDSGFNELKKDNNNVTLQIKS